PSDAAEIIAEQIIKGREVKRLLYKKDQLKGIVKLEDIDFYQKQFRIVLRNCGVINPEDIEEYIAREGYVALEKVLFGMEPDDVISELKTAGLRGRGGAGFPTWLKWDLTRKAPGEEKFVICNADEGDPGAYMDRSTIEGDPHSILEAMTIAGRTIGSHKGYVYIRAEYPLAIDRLRIAISQSKALGLLGNDILGSGYDFDVEIRLGAGAFVCGEETALMQSLEGKRGMPVPKPPFPAISGLWKKPTLINNVETYANIPVILVRGGAWFTKIGTEKSPGTKVFALTGKINNSGLVEVPMGTTLREIVFGIGGGIRGGRSFKGVQTGGPSGGIITERDLDAPITFESLTALGSMMGSGGMIVMDEDDCAVDVSRFYMEFCVDESCGKCAPCRIGTNQLHSILTRISKGGGTMADLDSLERIGKAMTKASLCLLGGSAANPTLSTLKHFRDEYVEHIRDHKCRAGTCKALVVYSIDPKVCIGCGLCPRRCPVNCIAGERKQAHVIDTAKCIKCGECFKVCKFNAVIKK
ncbi:MAG TPA: NADH-ubiquinone oxidoreductase-F iron-sulfur binding region domain-containing protein, partial [Magnetospirillaceae bacterium]|nr:NADH-ubiquinone oxidoreductase-F iron-sulfur binding region domain-containing protein [Magnetospirillaceae bacterium]